MGQYHRLVNITKGEVVRPHPMGDGAKAWEIACSGVGGLATACVYLLVAPTPRGGGDFPAAPLMGSWHGDRVAFIGDYFSVDDKPGDSDYARACLKAWHDEEPDLKDITLALRDEMGPLVGAKYGTGDGWVARLEGRSL